MTEQEPASDEPPIDEWAQTPVELGAESTEGPAKWWHNARITYDAATDKVHIDRTDGHGATIRLDPAEFDAFILGALEGQPFVEIDPPPEP
jgi:hypothetical protein